MDLRTTYMGLSLKNPLIAGASDLTANLDNIKKIEDAGAGALVVKSLFEEQVQLESLKLEEEIHKYDNLHAEMVTVFPEVKHAGPDEHLHWTRKAKEAVGIPVIASLNCVHREVWLSYAKQLEETGVDGLELNFYSVPTDFETPSRQIEENQIRIVKELKRAVKIPVSVKLSPFYTNPLHFISELDDNGVNGFVLFNRLFQPEINVEKEQHVFPMYLSHPDDHRLPLRFAGILHGYTKADVCSSTGIFTGQDAAKMILAGASCVQVVSAMYKNRIDVIRTMLNDLENWMSQKRYQTIGDFMGKLSRKNIADPWIYRRAQYVRMLMRGNPME